MDLAVPQEVPLVGSEMRSRKHQGFRDEGQCVWPSSPFPFLETCRSGCVEELGVSLVPWAPCKETLGNGQSSQRLHGFPIARFQFARGCCCLISVVLGPSGSVVFITHRSALLSSVQFNVEFQHHHIMIQTTLRGDPVVAVIDQWRVQSLPESMSSNECERLA